MSEVNTFIIDNNLRQIIIPDGMNILGVAGDIEVKCVSFEMPRYYNGIDMSEFDIFVDYENAKGCRNYYKVVDTKTHSSTTTQSSDNIAFTWTLESDVTAHQGTVAFAIRMVKRNGTKIVKQFDTDKATGIVLDGMNAFQRIPLSDQKDILGKIETDAVENIQENLNNYTAEKKTELNAYTDDKKNVINEFTDSCKSAITALTGEETKAITDLTTASKNEIDKTKTAALNDLSWKEPVDKNTADIASLNEDISEQESKLEPIVKSNEDSKNIFYIVDADGNIICKVDKDGVHSVGFDGKNLALNDVISTYDDSFYISDSKGNIIFKANKDGVQGLNMNNTPSTKSPYNTKKLISIGDSLSAHDKWQKWLVEWLGVSFDIDVNINGKDGHAPMAKGGTAIFPNSMDSIYIRALDAHYYNPDIIVLYAGQNDVPHFGSETDLNESSVGTINDIPYKKTVPYTDLQKDEYKDYTAWYEGRPTLYSYCMGLVENLLTSCSTAKIYVVTPMQIWTSTGEQSVGRKQLVTVWENICNKYGLPIVNLWNNSCVNAFNMEEYYPNVGNVHPNDFGYKRIAEIIYSKI